MKQLTIDEFFEMLEEAVQRQEAEEDQVDANPLYTNMYNALFTASKSRFPTLEELRALTLASTLPPL